MERIAPEIYSQINNHVYNEKGDLWWNPENILHILKTSVNPWRIGVAMDALNKLNFDPKAKQRLKWAAEAES